MVLFLDLLPVLLLLSIVCLLFWLARRWYLTRKMSRVLERHVGRSELERRVYPHLSSDERKLPWTEVQLQELDALYNSPKEVM